MGSILLHSGESVRRSALALLVTIGLCQSLSADVTFSFNFLDDPGVGFNAYGSTGDDRRAGLAEAGDYFSILFANYDATIEIDVIGSETRDTALASASSNYTSAYPGVGFGDAGDVMLKILGGDSADPSPGVADGEIYWNFEDFLWEPFSDFQPGELDLISTARHELMHAIGFISSIGEDGASAFHDAGQATAWSPFDEFVADSYGALIDDQTFEIYLEDWLVSSVGGTGPDDGLLFIGPNAMAANGGEPVPLYSPTTWSPGSSGSHTDTDYFTGSDFMMMNSEASVSEGLDIRELSAIELGILMDIGYADLIIPTVLEGDLNGDGFVGLDDLDIVLANWNQNVTAGDMSLGDISGDGFVGLDDLDVILNNWNAGTPPSGSAIPEPGTALTLTGLGLLVLNRRLRGVC